MYTWHCSWGSALHPLHIPWLLALPEAQRLSPPPSHLPPIPPPPILPFHFWQSLQYPPRSVRFRGHKWLKQGIWEPQDHQPCYPLAMWLWGLSVICFMLSLLYSTQPSTCIMYHATCLPEFHLHNKPTRQILLSPCVISPLLCTKLPHNFTA